MGLEYKCPLTGTELTLNMAHARPTKVNNTSTSQIWSLNNKLHLNFVQLTRENQIEMLANYNTNYYTRLTNFKWELICLHPFIVVQGSDRNTWLVGIECAFTAVPLVIVTTTHTIAGTTNMQPHLLQSNFSNYTRRHKHAAIIHCSYWVHNWLTYRHKATYLASTGLQKVESFGLLLKPNWNQQPFLVLQ